MGQNQSQLLNELRLEQAKIKELEECWNAFDNRLQQIEFSIKNNLIKGEKGETGETGEKGDKGDKGDKGEKGDKGIKPPKTPESSIEMPSTKEIILEKSTV